MTPTATSTGCTSPVVCMELNVTGVTEEFFASISYNNCYGQLINETFLTNGVRRRCVQYTMGVPQIFSYQGMQEPFIVDLNCNTGECIDPPPPTPTQTPSNTPTRTNTPTPTPSATIGSTPTQTPSNTATPTPTGTIVSTPTNTPTNTSTPTMTPTPTGGETVLNVYAKYINSNGVLEYQINFGPVVEIGPLGTSCDIVASIAVIAGDTITFTDLNNNSIAGSTTVCPDGPGGFGCDYSYSVLVSGPQNVYLTIDGSDPC